MSHSTHVGFNAPPATAFSGRLFRWYWLGPPLLLASCTVGVGNIAAAVARLMPVLLRPTFAKSGPAADAFGVGHIAGTLPCLSRTSRPAIAFASSSVAAPSSHALLARRTVPSHGIPLADGVGNIGLFPRTAADRHDGAPFRETLRSSSRVAASRVRPDVFAIWHVGVGHDPDPITAVWRTNG